MLLFPLLISAEPLDITDSVVIVNPLHFAGEAELYTYIVESVKSIQTFSCQPGLVNIDLEDIRALSDSPGRLAFIYGEHEASMDKSLVAKTALQKLYAMNIPAHSSKFIVLNITGNEENLSMFEIMELSEHIHEGLCNDDTCTIWGANIDNTLADKIHVSIWVKL